MSSGQAGRHAPRQRMGSDKSKHAGRYRTRKDRTRALTSDAHLYDKPGRYRVMVGVVEIFGNDTSQAYEVDVK